MSDEERDGVNNEEESNDEENKEEDNNEEDNNEDGNEDGNDEDRNNEENAEEKSDQDEENNDQNDDINMDEKNELKQKTTNLSKKYVNKETFSILSPILESKIEIIGKNKDSSVFMKSLFNDSPKPSTTFY